MGVICHTGNRLGKAEGHFLKSIYLDPNHYEALIHLSLLFEQKGDTTGSALYKERAKRLHENNNHMQNCWTHIGIYGDSS